MGKTSHDENFPVAWLVSPRFRRPVSAFYRFARMADNIADSSSLSGNEKALRLQKLQGALPLVGASEALALLTAFRRDVEGVHIASWNEFLAYCHFSAVPVGRFLLALFRESAPESEKAADALCIALQILDHVQDCGQDWRRHRRCYFPADWMAEEEADMDDLGLQRLSPPLRRVAERMLAAAANLLDSASSLHKSLAARQLRGQTAATIVVARRHLLRLRQRDPLTSRISPRFKDWSAAALQGILYALTQQRPAS